MAMLVHLKNLSSAATQQDVRKFFAQAEVEIPEGGLTIPKSKDGSAFINFSSSQELLEAVKLDGHELHGQAVKLLLITVEEKEEILTEIRKQELLAATRSEAGFSAERKKDRGKQGVKAQAEGSSTGSVRDSKFEDYLCVSGLPSEIGRKDLIVFLGASPSLIAKSGIVIRPDGDDKNFSIAFFKFISEEGFSAGLKRNGDTYSENEVLVRQSDKEEFEAELQNSGQSGSQIPVLDKRKRAYNQGPDGGEDEEHPSGKKTKPNDDAQAEGEAYYAIVKNLHCEIRPFLLKEIFGWIDYNGIVIREDKKDRSKCVAFMKFTDEKAYEKALAGNKEYLQGQQIFVREYSEAGFNSERNKYGTHADRQALSELYLFIANIEGSVSERDLRKFFGRKIWDAIPDDGILMRPDLKFPHKQVAYLHFTNKEAYETILNTDNRFLNGKYILVKKSTEKQFFVQKRFIEEERMQQMGNFDDYSQNMGGYNDNMMGGGRGERWNDSRGGGGGNYGRFDGNPMNQALQGALGQMFAQSANMMGNYSRPNNMGQGMNQGPAASYILVNNVPNHADVKWVHQLFDDCPLNVSKTRLVSEGMLPLYAYVQLQNDMDGQRACSRDGKRMDNVTISVRKVLQEAMERDLSTLPPRMRVSQMEIDEWFTNPQQKAPSDPFLESAHGRNPASADPYSYGQEHGSYSQSYNMDQGSGPDAWNEQQYDQQMGNQSHTPNAVLNAIKELETACGGNVEVIELKVLPNKLSHDSVYAWLKQQPGNLEVMGKNSDIVNYGNAQVEIILIALKNLTTALPKWAFIEKVICEIKHRSQRNACPGCRRLDHRSIGEGCPALSDINDVIYFDAADHPFSPLHMTMMPFVFKGKNFINILQAFLWEECHHLGYHDLRNRIMHVQDPTMANLKEFIFGIPKLEALNWEMTSYSLLGSLYKLKWEVCPQFREALYDTGSKMLVFANSRCSLGVGIQPSSLVRKINPLYYQGENIIGKIIMNIRDEKNHLYRE